MSSSSSSSRPTGGATGRNDNKGKGSGNSSSSVTSLSDKGRVNITSNKGTEITTRDRNVDKGELGTGKPNGGKPNGGGKPDNGGKPNGGGKPDNGGKPNGGGKPDNGGKPDGGNVKPDGGGKPKPGGTPRPGGNPKPGGGGMPHPDGGIKPRPNTDWTRPLPPPARPHRPAPLVWWHPEIPVGWAPYPGAPIIDRILGINFGTLYYTSLDYLYYNGYEIDGYADHIIYLRNVNLLDYNWDDVMLIYDDYDRLVNAQFIYHSSRYTRTRYERIYKNLCRVYGRPVASNREGISWYGGSKTGWVTLSMRNDGGRNYYTILSIGYSD